MISHGSEGIYARWVIIEKLQYSTISYGSEGCHIRTSRGVMVQYSMYSHDSEELYFIYNIIDSLFTCFFCERQFKTNVQGFIFMNLYWPIGNCLYQLAFSFIEIIYVLQCPLELGSQGLLFSYYICRFCVCFFMKCPSFRTKI